MDAIAVVHDTLAQGLTQKVDFDEVFHRVLKLVAEVASAPNTRARTQSTDGSEFFRASTRHLSRSP